jgi:hypothetical protein
MLLMIAFLGGHWEITSSGVVEKKLSNCCTDILKGKKQIHWLAEIAVLLPSKICKRNKNGSVVQNEVKHIRKKQNNINIIPNKSNTLY